MPSTAGGTWVAVVPGVGQGDRGQESSQAAEPTVSEPDLAAAAGISADDIVKAASAALARKLGRTPGASTPKLQD
jgi:hypothetical protein